MLSIGTCGCYLCLNCYGYLRLKSYRALSYFSGVVEILYNGFSAFTLKKTDKLVEIYVFSINVSCLHLCCIYIYIYIYIYSASRGFQLAAECSIREVERI